MTVVLYGVVHAWIAPTHPDVAWLAYLAGRVLEGDTLYVDLMEVNPPLIVWLSLPPALLSGAGLSVALATDLWTLTVVGGALVVLARVLTSSFPSRSAGRLVIWSASFVLLQLVGYQFGQREHLMLAMVLPYALVAAASAAGRRTSPQLAIVAGILAGVGFAIKPHFLLGFGAVEIYLAARIGCSSFRRPETVATLGMTCLYGIAVATFTPQYLSMAIAARDLYSDYGRADLLIRRSWVVAGVLGAAWGAHRWSHNRLPEWRETVSVVSVLGIGLLGAVYAQGKGFTYHWYPAVAIGVILLFLVVGRVVRKPFAALALAASLTFVVGMARSATLPWRNEELRLVVTGHAPVDGIAALSSVISSGFPLTTQLGARWTLRYPALWQVEAFYAPGEWTRHQYRHLEEMGHVERAFVETVVSDLVRGNPEILIVDAFPPAEWLRGFDFREYLRADPRFAALIENYDFVANADGRYRVYHRSHQYAGERQPSPLPSHNP